MRCPCRQERLRRGSHHADADGETPPNHRGHRRLGHRPPRAALTAVLSQNPSLTIPWPSPAAARGDHPGPRSRRAPPPAAASGAKPAPIQLPRRYARGTPRMQTAKRRRTSWAVAASVIAHPAAGVAILLQRPPEVTSEPVISVLPLARPPPAGGQHGAARRRSACTAGPQPVLPPETRRPRRSRRRARPPRRPPGPAGPWPGRAAPLAIAGRPQGRRARGAAPQLRRLRRPGPGGPDPRRARPLRRKVRQRLRQGRQVRRPRPP